MRNRREFAEFKLDDRIEIRPGDATDLNDLSDDELSKYDLIIINLALHEMGREYRKVVRRVCQAVKEGGAVVICDFFAASKAEEVAAYRDLVYQQWLSLYLHQVLLGSSMISFEELRQFLERQDFNPPHVIGHPINGYLIVVAEKKK
jgi:predicted O-methyltransferase YrrM